MEGEDANGFIGSQLPRVHSHSVKKIHDKSFLSWWQDFQTLWAKSTEGFWDRTRCGRGCDTENHSSFVVVKN